MTLPPINAWVFDQVYWPTGGPERDLIPFPGHAWDAATGIQQYEDHLNYLARADELGFDGVCLTEHHFTPFGLASPNVLAAALAVKTQRAKIVLMGNILPLHPHPVRLAEELAMIDVLSKGRLVSGLMRGGFTEWHAYSLDPTDNREKYEEAWDLIVACFERQEPFDWNGKHYHYKGISIVPRSVQKPHPPMIMAGSTGETIEWCAKRRIPLACSFAPIESMAMNYEYYREVAAEHGWTPGPEHAIFSRQVYVAETDEQAYEEVWPHLQAFWHEVPVARKLPGDVERYRDAQRTPHSFDYKKGKVAGGPYLMESLAAGKVPELSWLIDQGLAIVGSPKSVIAQIRRQQEAFGAGTVLLYAPFGTLPMDLANKSLEIFARDVLPELSKAVEASYA